MSLALRSGLEAAGRARGIWGRGCRCGQSVIPVRTRRHVQVAPPFVPFSSSLRSAMRARARCHSPARQSDRNLCIHECSLDAAAAMVMAIRDGDLEEVGRLLEGSPGLASTPLSGPHGSRTALHVAADWPGYFPNAPEVVRVLIEAGADSDARSPGKQFAETPLHWAASSNDVDVASALIDGGANIEIPDGSIETPLDNAIGYACWNVARLTRGPRSQSRQALACSCARVANPLGAADRGG